MRLSLNRLAMIVVALTATGRIAHAQAWVGDPKSLTLGLAYHYVPSTAVIDTPDIVIADRPTQNHLITLAAEYVPIENLAIEAQVPFALLQYKGTMPHLPPGKWDDGSVHATLTDFRANVRYQLLDEPYVALTPYVGFTIPMMKYEVIGFATGGRHLKQAHFGASVGRTLSPILPDLFVMASYEYTLSEHSDVNEAAKEINQNRSDVEAQLGYLFLDGDLNIAAVWTYRKQHGGINFEDFAKGLDPALQLVHDPILREEYMFLGANASYAVTTKIGVGLVFRYFLTGYNTRDQMLIGADFSYRLF